MKFGRVGSLQLMIGLLFLIAAVLVLTNWSDVKVPLINSCNALLGERFCGSEIRYVVASLLWAICILPAILLLEVFFPAKKSQPIFPVGLFQDFLWFFSLIFFVSLVLSIYSSGVSEFVDENLSMLKIDLIASMPVSLQIVTVIIISDFIGWFDHWTRHKIPFFWALHKVHHAPRQLNFFTNERLHPMDYVAIVTVGIPFLFLDLEVAVPAFIGWTIFKEVHLYFVHANIRTDLGPLRYILTTPQSHRIHHSIERKHQDQNFAVHFVIWDFLFGTQWKEWDEYPDTGVEDDDFPLETTRRIPDLLVTLFKQVIYPFKKFLPKFS